jgi:hypothetical protein
LGPRHDLEVRLPRLESAGCDVHDHPVPSTESGHYLGSQLVDRVDCGPRHHIGGAEPREASRSYHEWPATRAMESLKDRMLKKSENPGSDDLSSGV